jgi:peptide/nickel transport system permease protein
MQFVYIVRRFLVFLLIIWLAATLNFFLPKLSGQDPVRTKLLAEASLGGYVQAGIEDMVKVYQEKFGLDKPLWRQYLNYLDDVSAPCSAPCWRGLARRAGCSG